MSLLFSLLPSGVLQAISRVLLHSIWQGLLLAVVAAVVVLCTRHSRPAVRYNLLLITWALFLVCVAGTAIREATQFNKPIVPSTSVSSTPVYISSLSSAGQRFLAVLDHYSTYIFSAWFIFFLCKLIYLLAGLGHIRHLRQTNVTAPPVAWQQRLQELAAQLQIRRRVVLLQSALARVPLVTGIVKPVILLPAGLITQLPPDQVEAILLHELAHVRRQDYLVNLVQQLAEAIFFFNPGLLWVSRLIKDERENCCDELALQQLPDRRQLIHALVAFQEYHLAGYPPAPAFPGRPPHLLTRVQRMLSRRNSLLSKWEFRTLTVCLVLLLVTLTSLVVPDNLNEKENTADSAFNTGRDTIPTAAVNLSPLLPVPVVMPAAQQSGIHPAEVCAPSPVATTTSTTKTTTTTTTTTDDGDPANVVKVIDNISIPLHISIGKNGNTTVTRNGQTIENSSKKTGTTRYFDNGISVEVKDGKLHKLMYEQDKNAREKIKEADANAQRIVDEEMYKHGENIKRNLPVSKITNEHGDPRVNEITRALVNEKLLPDPYPAVTSGKVPNISYMLSNDELIVNGIKQPDAIHSRLKSRFLKPGMTVKVNWQS